MRATHSFLLGNADEYGGAGVAVLVVRVPEPRNKLARRALCADGVQGHRVPAGVVVGQVTVMGSEGGGEELSAVLGDAEES